MAEIHVGDVGTRFTVTVTDDGGVPVDVSTATTKELKLRPPSGSTLQRAAAFVTDGSNGRLYYDTVAGDLSAPGEWELQAHVILPSGEWHSDITTFDVVGNL